MSGLFRKRLLAGVAPALLLGAASPAMAQTIVLDPIVVSPARTPLEKSKVGSTVEVVDQETIEEEARPLIVDYLNQIPGISIAPSGGTGQEMSLQIRGADKKYVKTLFNGIDISDPTAPQVQTSFEHFLSDGVTGIEVLKGSQGTLYGADAVAGVISLTTLGNAPDGLSGRMRFEGGSFGTARGAVGVTNVFGGTRFSANVSGLYTDGISAADSRNGNSERDGYRNFGGDIALEQTISDTLSFFVYGLVREGRVEFDDSGNPPRDNWGNVGRNSTAAGRAGFNVDLMDGRFRNTFSVQAYEVDRNLYTTTFGPFEIDYDGSRQKIDYQGAFDVNDRLTLMAGADYERRDLLITNVFSTTDAGDHIAGVWGQAIVEPIDDLTLSGGVRHDQHSKFGGYTTWRGTAAYTLASTGTTLRTSGGTGFRAPSPYENNYMGYLFPTVPVPNLKPEESVSFDVGIDQTLLDGRAKLSATYFILNTDNLIDYDFVNDTYIQIPGTTKRNGVELAAAYDVSDWLTLGANYTYTRSVEAGGARRPRVPRHMIGVSATATPWEKWSFSGSAKVAVDTVDVVSSALVPLDDYVLVDAKVGYKPTEDTELYVRAENLLNQDYQLVKGYGTRGLSVYAGFAAKF